MTYRDSIYISTDSHVTEPIELYEARVDAAYRGRVPRIETVGEWRKAGHPVRGTNGR